MATDTPHGYEVLDTHKTEDYTYVFIQSLNPEVKDIFAAVLCDQTNVGLTFPIKDEEDMSVYGNPEDADCMFCQSETEDVLTAKGLYPVPPEPERIIPYNESEEVWMYFCVSCWEDIREQLDLQEYDDLETLISRRI